MRILTLAIVGLLAAGSAAAQQNRPPRPEVMTLTTSTWEDGGVIPAKHSQPGRDVSPPLVWDNVPEGTTSFVLMVRDLESITDTGADRFLHWMVWKIPGSMRGLAENQPDDALPDGMRQISSSGPWYRGPAAPAAGPAHHYVFELYALSAPIDVPAVGQTPRATQSAVQEAMAGKILGKGVLVGRYRRH